MGRDQYPLRSLLSGFRLSDSGKQRFGGLQSGGRFARTSSFPSSPARYTAQTPIDERRRFSLNDNYSPRILIRLRCVTTIASTRNGNISNDCLTNLEVIYTVLLNRA